MSFLFAPGQLLCPSDGLAAQELCTVNLTTGLIDQNSALTVSCEFGACLPGQSIFALRQSAPSSDAKLYLFGYDLSSIASPTVFSAVTFHGASPVTSDYNNTFYVANNGITTSSQVKSVSAAGSVGGTTFAISTHVLGGMCVSPGASVLYFADITNDLGGGALKTWVIGTNLAGPDLVAGVSGALFGVSAICLPAGDRTGDILIPYQPNTAIDTWQINRYTPAGALVQVYPLVGIADAGGGEDVHLSIDPTYPNTFWTRTFPTIDGNTSVFTQWSLNGTQLQQTVQATTASVTSISPSCPFFGNSQTLVPPPPGPPFAPTALPPIIGGGGTGIGGGTIYPIRRVRRTPQMTDELFWLFVSRFELMFNQGAGNPLDPSFVPRFMVRWSTDGGNTWSNEILLSAGRQGAYWTRAFITRGPRGRNIVWEVSTSDPVPWVLTDALVQFEKGTS